MANGVADISETLCGALTDLGCTYEIEFDNRGGKRSRYIYVRRPILVKIRVSDHRSDRMEKDKARSKQMMFDVGKHALSPQDAIRQLHEAICHGRSHRPPRRK